MSEENQSNHHGLPNTATSGVSAPSPIDELANLKARADMLGVTYSNNIGVDTLRERIREHQAKAEGTKEETAPVNAQADDEPDQETLPLNMVSDPVVLRRRMYNENMFLVRIRVANLNPLKKDIPGEWITVHNKFLGTVRKYVPFGEATDVGYHVPKIILDVLKSRKFLSLKPRTDKGGSSIPTSQWVKEFAIEELPYLTLEELEQLKRQQAAAKGL